MIRGVRGAITVEGNQAEEIIFSTEELIAKMIEMNQIDPKFVASVFISTTADLTATFPAKALRKFEGWTFVPVMCMREMDVPSSLDMCIRVMMHINTEVSQEHIHHVYLRKAIALRPDLNNN
ncbi:MAG: chorismate mutase [Bacillota bacterium]|nr:chorismate mutase [Bacillota bacterium]